MPLFEKRMRIMIINPKEMSPPVAVVYYDYLLNFKNWFVEKRSIFFKPFLKTRVILWKNIAYIYLYIRKNLNSINLNYISKAANIKTSNRQSYQYHLLTIAKSLLFFYYIWLKSFFTEFLDVFVNLFSIEYYPYKCLSSKYFYFWPFVA